MVRFLTLFTQPTQGGDAVKKLALVALVAALVMGVGAPAYAFKCPSLIRQANEQMAKMDQNSDKVKQAKALAEEADKLHKAGNHAESVKKAEEALALLK
jgi:uncharacterized protein HemX